MTANSFVKQLAVISFNKISTLVILSTYYSMFIIRGHFYSILFTTELRIKNFLKCSFGRERKEGGIIVETNCCLIKNTFCNIKCMQKAGSKLFHVIVVCDINAQSHILVLFHEAIRLCYCQCYQLTFIWGFG